MSGQQSMYEIDLETHTVSRSGWLFHPRPQRHCSVANERPNSTQVVWNYCLGHCVEKRRRGPCAQRVCRHHICIAQHPQNRTVVMTSTHSGPSASAAVVRGARETEALPEELRSRQFLPRGRKLKFIVVEGAVLGKKTKCSRKYCTTRGESRKAMNTTTICSASPKSKSSSGHTCIFRTLTSKATSRAPIARETDAYVWMGKFCRTARCVLACSNTL